MLGGHGLEADFWLVSVMGGSFHFAVDSGIIRRRYEARPVL
jgi:hypothetical protein